MADATVEVNHDVCIVSGMCASLAPEILYVAVAPVNRRRSRCFTFVGRNYAFDRDQEFHDMQYVILGQDQPIVESQRPEELPVDLTAEMHVKGADAGTVEYRRWLISIASGDIALAPTG